MTTHEDESTAETLDRLRQRVQGEGAEAAIDALIEVARDKKSTSQARATAGTSILRAAGFFERGQDGPQKQPHEMTAEELEQEIQRLTKQAQRAKHSVEDDGLFD